MHRVTIRNETAQAENKEYKHNSRNQCSDIESAAPAFKLEYVWLELRGVFARSLKRSDVRGEILAQHLQQLLLALFAVRGKIDSRSGPGTAREVHGFRQDRDEAIRFGPHH